MKLTKIISILFVIIILSGCEKGTDVACNVANNTNEEMTVTLYYKYLAYGNVTETIKSGESKDVFVSGRSVGGFHSQTSVTDIIDSLTAVTPTGKVLNKEFNTDTDWSKEVIEKQQKIVFKTTIDSNYLK